MSVPRYKAFVYDDEGQLADTVRCEYFGDALAMGSATTRVAPHGLMSLLSLSNLQRLRKNMTPGTWVWDSLGGMVCPEENYPGGDEEGLFYDSSLTTDADREALLILPLLLDFAISTREKQIAEIEKSMKNPEAKEPEAKDTNPRATRITAPDYRGVHPDRTIIVFFNLPAAPPAQPGCMWQEVKAETPEIFCFPSAEAAQKVIDDVRQGTSEFVDFGGAELIRRDAIRRVVRL